MDLVDILVPNGVVANSRATSKKQILQDLARKAASLQDRASLAGWLYTSTRFAAADLVRSAQRRRQHEQQAAGGGRHWFCRSIRLMVGRIAVITRSIAVGFGNVTLARIWPVHSRVRRLRGLSPTPA